MEYSEPNPAISATNTAPTGKTFCVNCGSPILVGARICAVCKTYQSQWRNMLLFVGSIAGFITLLASGVTFIFAQLSSIIKTEKIAVSYLSYPGEVLLINTGDKEVFVSSLEVYWNSRNHNERISLNASIKAGEFKSITPAFFDPRTGAIEATPQNEFETYLWIVNRSGAPNHRLFA